MLSEGASRRSRSTKDALVAGRPSTALTPFAPLRMTKTSTLLGDVVAVGQFVDAVAQARDVGVGFDVG
jgi:hypothetical protein